MKTIHSNISSEIESRQFDLLLALFDNDNTDVSIFDGEGTYLAVSQSYLEHNGLTKENIIGRNVRDLMNEGVFSPSVTIKTLEEKKKSTLVQKNWLGKTILTTGTPIFSEDGSIRYIVCYNSIDISELTTTEDKLNRINELMREFNISAKDLDNDSPNEKREFVTRCKIMKQVVSMIDQIADTPANVVITGETGVGKSFAARYIHEHSNRSDKPFVEVDCSSIPQTLIESELFGYESGAFTGASKGGKPGKIEAANGGTLFLDEIAELPLEMQVKLLKTIQEKQVTRVGGITPINLDFRLIVATNKNLYQEVENGTFRKDLYYRLLVISVNLPPLRDRREDISVMASSFLKKFNRIYNKKAQLTPDAIALLESSDWPGNIRELENTIERLVLLSVDNIISYQDVQTKKGVNFTNPFMVDHTDISLTKMLESYESNLIRSYYEQYHTSVAVAKKLKISQPTAARRLRKYVPEYNE
ncbi:MAG: sigma 54-interacting transcriptional regulator [Erysipelotrichaceae bacterium]|nr:sigma 54-interacting transcriptional regulator [Erysipelotrichaceae bacterium]